MIRVHDAQKNLSTDLGVFLCGIAGVVSPFRPDFPTHLLRPGCFRGPEDMAAILSLAFPVSASFFFFLSGYVLSCVYLHNVQIVDKSNFFAARFARLYPLYFVVLVLNSAGASGVRNPAARHENWADQDGRDICRKCGDAPSLEPEPAAPYQPTELVFVKRPVFTV